MLSVLSIRDIVLIRELDIEFDGGLAVLSGETGAGKSILLDSLSLALGARGDGDLVRVGQKQGQVSAIFDVEPDHHVFELLKENDLAYGGGQDSVILRRTQNADGRTRAYVNDQPVSVALLKQIGQALVEIHGQHEERAMVDPATHRDLVDAFGRLAPQRNAVAEAHQNWRQAARELKDLKARVEQANRDADYLRSSVEELSQLAPQEGEEEELAGRRQTMMAAEKIASDLDEAYQVLAGQASPIPTLVNTMRKLERKSDSAPGVLDSAIECFGVAVDALAQAETELERALRLSEFDPQELENAEERLFALRAASRKYKVPVEGLAAHSQKMGRDLADLDAGEDRLLELEQQTQKMRAVLETKAADLSEARRQAGEVLSDKVMVELPALKLEKARFFVDLQSMGDEIGSEGNDLVEFHVQTNPGTRPGALMKVASGGELSRFLLALKVVLADRGSAPTLVFDEIDTGVGGAVADAIGGRLSNLSRHVQVLSVTHAPQVAARAQAHFLISKDGEQDVETRIHTIDGDSRLEEIARMLSGAQVTAEARAAAARLLEAG
ncbi:MAG: DNA repair protein RecN [Rhizobiaceae bacterium]|nr:DNA repair protein RecN [Hyphomicrobiales bacterium]NRB31496.1 DNA repair protein RecN [Rhizobiaceae bacterium]